MLEREIDNCSITNSLINNMEEFSEGEYLDTLERAHFGPEQGETFINNETWAAFLFCAVLDHVLAVLYYFFMCWVVFDTHEFNTMVLVAILFTALPFVYLKLAVVSFTRLGYTDTAICGCFWLYLIPSDQNTAHRHYNNIFMIVRNIVLTLFIFLINGFYLAVERNKNYDNKLVDSLY